MDKRVFKRKKKRSFLCFKSHFLLLRFCLVICRCPQFILLFFSLQAGRNHIIEKLISKFKKSISPSLRNHIIVVSNKQIQLVAATSNGDRINFIHFFGSQKFALIFGKYIYFLIFHLHNCAVIIFKQLIVSKALF